MGSKHFVYAYESEPALDRTTGFGRTDYSTPSESMAVWSTTEHSTFDQPSRAKESVKQRRVRRENRRLIETMVIAAVAVMAAIAVALLR